MNALAVVFKPANTKGMSWRPKPKPNVAHLSMDDFKGLLQANQIMTDAQMAKELEKKGWSVKKQGT